MAAVYLEFMNSALHIAFHHIQIRLLILTNNNIRFKWIKTKFDVIGLIRIPRMQTVLTGVERRGPGSSQCHLSHIANIGVRSEQ